MDRVLFIHSPVDGHLGGFYFSAAVDPAALTAREQVFVRTCFQFSWARPSDLDCWACGGSMVDRCGAARLFSQAAAAGLPPAGRAQGFPCLPSLTNACGYLSF